MSEATYFNDGETIQIASAAAAYASGQVLQAPDGRAGVVAGLKAVASGDAFSLCVHGIHTVAKVSAQVWIDGAPIWWDHSANEATCVPQYADKDFYLGTAVGDVATAVASGKVNLNTKPSYIVDINGSEGGSGGDTAVVLTSGTPTLVNRGGMLEASFSATAEAQKLDWLSKRSFPLSSNWILEAVVEIVTNADADVADLSIGVANGTHASDADSITESAFFHFDLGADLNIDAESDDGTTEVAATDTTIDFAVGTPVHLVLDGRDPSNVKYYINGSEVLSATANLGKIDAATGPLRALFHLEKSANDSPGVVQLDMLRVRTMEQ